MQISRPQRILRLQFRKSQQAFLVALLLFSATSGNAESLAGKSFPSNHSIDSKAFVLNGLGLREATIFSVDVYVAALYLEGGSKDTSSESILSSDKEKILHLDFIREVSVDKIREAWDLGFRQNGSELPAIAQQIDSFQKAMRTMKEGERMSMHFKADGIELQLPGAATQSFPGKDFSRAVLAIWLGPNPPNEELKLGLLGQLKH